MKKPNIIGDTMTAKERLEIPSRGLQGWLNKWKTKNKIRQKERELSELSEELSDIIKFLYK